MAGVVFTVRRDSIRALANPAPPPTNPLKIEPSKNNHKTNHKNNQMSDQIRYDLLTQRALRGVVRDVLVDVTKKKALPGDHHFYISFDTTADGVRLSQRLRAQYPEEMTIILQHQFWDMAVNDDGFEVGLSFGGIPEKLAIPFDAIKGFFDPSVQFGLQFEEISEGGQDNKAAPASITGKSNVLPERKSGNLAGNPAPQNTNANPPPPTAEASSDEGKSAPAPAKPASGEVVQLDRFRKK